MARHVRFGGFQEASVASLIGGFLASTVFNWDINTFSPAGFTVAVAGALLLLLLYRLVTSTRRVA
jgi:uncharacterized membrane protein YeaQ/YmgE (transglycosylase-associated protein family)